jgi:hypothetical protein
LRLSADGEFALGHEAAGPCPRQIDRATWDAAQSVVGERGDIRDAEMPTSQPGRRYPLRGRIRCKASSARRFAAQAQAERTHARASCGASGWNAPAMPPTGSAANISWPEPELACRWVSTSGHPVSTQPSALCVIAASP